MLEILGVSLEASAESSRFAGSTFEVYTLQ